MSSLALLILIIAVVAVVLIGAVIGLLARGRKPAPLPDTHTDVLVHPPETGVDTAAPPVEVSAPPATLEQPESTASRLVRLRQRLAGSQGGFGRGLLTLLSRDRLDEDTWESIEDILLTADLGVGPTQQVVEGLRTRLRVEGAPQDPKAALREELVTLVDPAMDRRLQVSGADGKPGVVLVVGVNGTGKTTTVGKLARILVAEDRTVTLGAADTFRAAAVDQLATWGERVGVEVVRGAEAPTPRASRSRRSSTASPPASTP